MSEQFREYLQIAFNGQRLSREQARAALDAIIDDQANDAQTAALIGAIESRGVEPDEIAGFADAMRAHAITVEIDRQPCLDNCGTGGDGLHTFNISTAAALVAAGAGAALAKHGNRAISSRCGSADVLEVLGVQIDGSAEQVKASIEQHGFGFFFAPRFHPALKNVAHMRRSLGVRTVFNLLGPLVNPALVRRQVVGIFDGDKLEVYARVLLALGVERAMVLHGDDGMDELSLAGPTRICHASLDGGTSVESITPEDVGLQRADPQTLAGGDAEENARIIEQLLDGLQGPIHDATVFNAAASLVVTDLAPTMRDGVALARESISTGRAAAVLTALRKYNPRNM